MFTIIGLTVFQNPCDLHASTDLELYVNCLKSVCICRQLLADVTAAFEDAFQVGPRPLDLNPDHQHRVSHSQLFLQFHDLEQEVIHMLALKDALQLNLEDIET